MTAHPEPDPFAALGDPHRRAILRSLATADKSVQELADEMPISRPAVSRHLRVLKSAGLVADSPEGTRRIYRLETAGAEEARRYMEEVWGAAAARFKIIAENT